MRWREGRGVVRGEACASFTSPAACRCPHRATARECLRQLRPHTANARPDTNMIQAEDSRLKRWRTAKDELVVV